MQIKVLIVDDDITLIQKLGTTFTTILQNYLVLTATTANAALNMFKDQRPDLVILDIRLGPLSGMDLLHDFNKYLDENRIQRKPHFIVITAYPDEDVKKKALEIYRVDDFLLKPFEPSELRNSAVRSIRKILETELNSLPTPPPKS